MTNLIVSQEAVESNPRFCLDHLNYLEKRYVLPEHAAEAGLRALSADEWKSWGKFKTYPGLPCYPMGGLLVPYQDCLDGLKRVRIRPDRTTYQKGEPGAEETCETKRWVTCSGEVVPWIPPWALDETVRSNASVPIFVVEAPVKAIALRRVGAMAIAMGGVMAGAHDVEASRKYRHLALNQEMSRINWKGRRVYVAFDAGAANNPAVAYGEARLAYLLREAGADVRLVRIPLVTARDVGEEDLFDPRDQGPDDFLARAAKAGGDAGALAAWEALVKAAKIADPVERAEEELAEASDGEKRNVVRTLLADLPWVASIHVGGKAAATMIGQMGRKWSLTAGVISEALQEFGKALAAKSKESAALVLKRGDEVELAQTIVTQYVKDQTYRLVADGGSLYQCGEDNLWKAIADAQVLTAVGDLAGTPVGTGEKLRPLCVSHKVTKGTLALVLAKQEKIGFFADAPRGIAFNNGFIRVEDKKVELEPHHWVQASRTRLEGEYTPGQEPKKVLAFLREVFAGPECEEKIQCFREFAGASILGLAPKFGKAMILKGDGSDGKSVLLGLLERAVGGGQVAHVPPQELSHPYFRAALDGKLMNIVYDLNEKRLVDTGDLKASITGDAMVARNPAGRPFNVTFNGGHLLALNQFFPTADTTYGFRRRWLLIECPNQFTGDKINVHLLDELTEEIPEFLGWLVDGAKALLARGAYTVPESSEIAISAWLKESDHVALFLDECVATLSDQEKQDATNWTRACDLYEAYRTWAAQNGHKHEVTAISFAKRLKSLRKVEPVQRAKGAYYPVQLLGAREEDEEGLIRALRTPANDLTPPSVEPPPPSGVVDTSVEEALLLGAKALQTLEGAFRLSGSLDDRLVFIDLGDETLVEQARSVGARFRRGELDDLGDIVLTRSGSELRGLRRAS